jgi:long-subunit fatty acid transport protein
MIFPVLSRLIIPASVHMDRIITSLSGIGSILHFCFQDNSHCGKSFCVVKKWSLKLNVLLIGLVQTLSVFAVPVEIVTPGGTITVNLSHAGPDGQLVDPAPPDDGGFQPPVIFAAPLPVGSGARALGQGGAFTAVADDATAASWNPAGLVQLERPEVSAVYRFSAREDRHESQSSNLDVGHNRTYSSELNYLSVAYPFIIEGVNAVASLNYQETYDFSYEFTARFQDSARNEVDSFFNQSFAEYTTNNYSDPSQDITVVAEIITDAESRINQVLNSALLAGIDFKQSGTIDAFSPAVAFELSPRFSIGVALNFYTDGDSRGNPIESTMDAAYEGTTDSTALITDRRESTAHISWSGVTYSGDPDDPVITPVSGAQTNGFSEVSNNLQEDPYVVDGHYHEENRTENFHGINATIGALWVVGDQLSLGATIDLPWTGTGDQTKQVEHQVTTYDSLGNVVASDSSSETRKSEVEYTFPLYWSIGGLWRWSDRLYTSADISRTHWSDFSYTADEESSADPASGAAYGHSSIDDCWSLRFGGEYLWVLSKTVIPLRAGLFWEERPAVDSPDEYWGFSLGSGVSLGRLILDVAYVYEQGNNVLESLLPDQSSKADSTKHQIFISGIWHF